VCSSADEGLLESLYSLHGDAATTPSDDDAKPSRPRKVAPKRRRTR